MRELRKLVEAAQRLRAAEQPFLVSTVVAVRGSAYRSLGARMLSTTERWVAGSVSGGCLERDVLRKGFFYTREARALLISHDEMSDERTGTGCQGQVDLLIERAATPGSGAADRHAACDPLLLAERCLREETSAAVATVFRSTRARVQVGDRLALVGDDRFASIDDTALEAELSPVLRAMRERTQTFVSAEGDVEALLESIAAPPHLFVFGAGHDAAALVSLAEALGLSTSVWSEHLLERAARERFGSQVRLLVGALSEAVDALDRSALPLAVVMGHHYERDRAALAALLGSRARYLGVLGPLQRTQRMLEDLVQNGTLEASATSSLLDARMHAPAGLDLGSRTPSEVALSILAEIQANLHSASARSLRKKQRAIHA